jgi:hypothetical protein
MIGRRTAVVKHLAGPQAVAFSAVLRGAEDFGAENILFSLTESPYRIVWALPMHAAHISHFRFVVNGPNEVAAVQLDRRGLHMRLPTGSIRCGVLCLEPPNWEEVWTRGDAVYEGTSALLMRRQLFAEFVPSKRKRGERGPGKGTGAVRARHAKDAFAAHVLVENLRTRAGIFNDAIDKVARAHPQLRKRVWPAWPEPPHSIRKYIQREVLAAKRIQ